jgi:hypothetical protein
VKSGRFVTSGRIADQGPRRGTGQSTVPASTGRAAIWTTTFRFSRDDAATPDTTITITFHPTVRQLAMMERLEANCGVSLIRIIQRATAKGLDQMYIDQYGPQTGPWFTMDDDTDGIPVSPEQSSG